MLLNEIILSHTQIFLLSEKLHFLGQKCIYILPGDTEKETYRMSTFLKFPSESPVNPCLLAKYGFYYTGYKDRVKCFR